MALSCRQVHLGVNGPKKQVSVQETKFDFFFFPHDPMCVDTSCLRSLPHGVPAVGHKRIQIVVGRQLEAGAG